jgi:lysophospholipase L1-like esterase
MSVFVGLSVLLASLFAIAALAEFGARRWLRIRNEHYVWAPYYRNECDLDPRMFANFGSRVRFSVNSEGERGYEPPTKCDSLYRVLVAGGSGPECLMLDQEDSWPVILQRTLERPENLKKLGVSRVHVGNIGKSGVGSEALSFILRAVLRPGRRLDLVILMVGATDVFEWLRAGAPATPIRSITVPADASRYFAWHPYGPFSWRPRRTALAELVRRLLRLVIRPIRHRKDSGKWLIRARTQRTNALEVRLEIQNPWVLIDHFEFHFRQALITAKATAKRVIVARQPWMERNEINREGWENLWHGAVGGDAYRDEVKVFYSSEILSCLMLQIDQRTLKVAAEIGVECCELRSAIDPTFNSYYDLVHFTPAGSAKVAAILLASILRPPRESVIAGV